MSMCRNRLSLVAADLRRLNPRDRLMVLAVQAAIVFVSLPRIPRSSVLRTTPHPHTQDLCTRSMHWAFSPLTPALSPLRGEGARSIHGAVWRIASAQRGSLRCSSSAPMKCVCSRPRLSAKPEALIASPSPLNGERAGVRGENVADAPRSAGHCQEGAGRLRKVRSCVPRWPASFDRPAGAQDGSCP